MQMKGNTTAGTKGRIVPPTHTNTSHNNRTLIKKEYSFTWEDLIMICRLASTPLDNHDQAPKSMQSANKQYRTK